jgi:protein farnesyltransferase subunit beta
MDCFNRGTKTDGFPTHTSDEQIQVENLLSNFKPGKPSSESPTLNKNAHINFLVRMLLKGMPSRHVSQDASQPWILFWVLQSLSIMGVGIDPDNKQRYVQYCYLSIKLIGGFFICELLLFAEPSILSCAFNIQMVGSEGVLINFRIF